MPTIEPTGLASPIAGLDRLDRYLSLPLIFGLLAAATFAIAWNRGIALLYALFAVLVGAALVSVAGARWMLRAATVRLALPREASVGDWIHATLAVVPQARPHRRHLLQLGSLYPFASRQHLFLPVCGAGITRGHRVLCSRRGVFRISEVDVECAYPLGLLTMTRTWAVEPAFITVYPRVHPATSFVLPATSPRSGGEPERPAPSVGQELFREIREYRSGDNPRHIHWRSSARHGRLIVKQFEAIATSETWIVLDLDPANHAGQGEDHSFERAVEIAATVASRLIRSGVRCGIAGGLRENGPLLLLPPAAGGAHLRSTMDALAAVQADCSASYAAVLAALSPHYRRGQQWILFQHGEGRTSAPAFLRNQRPPLWFRFDTASFAAEDPSPGRLRAAGRLADGFSIARDTDLAALFPMTQPIRVTGLFVGVWAALTLAAAARAAVSYDAPVAALGVLFWGSVQGVGLWLARTADGPPPARLIGAVAAIGLAACALQLLSEGVLQATMSLLLWLQAARNPALATRRDVYFALGISITLVIFAAAEARSSAFVALMAAYGLSVLATLVYCHEQAGLESELQAQAPAPDGTAGSLLPFTHLAALSALVFLVASAWYLLVPRPDPLHFAALSTKGGDKYYRADWEREARNPGRRNPGPDSDGRTPRESPARGNELQPDNSLDITRSNQGGGGQPANAIVMYVQADRPLYLRRRTFDRFENNRWSASDTNTRKLLPEDGGEFRLSPPVEGVKVEYMAHVVSTTGNALPLSAHAVALAAPAGVIAAARDGTVYLPARLEPGFQYRAVSMLPSDRDRPTAHDLPRERAPYLQLPEGFSPRISELAGRVSARASSAVDKAVALESHLRSAYAYSFETVLTSQNVTPLEAFLFDTRRGHCEFFASAMAVMLRAVGIPSRVVHGYLAQNFNPVTGFYEVRAFDGHAWVEAQIEGVGWMTFEPTAAYPVPQRQPQTGTALFDLKTYTEQLSLQEALQGKSSLTAALAAVLRELAEAWHALLFQIRSWMDALQQWLGAHFVPLAAAMLGAAAAAVLIHRERIRLSWLWARIALRAAPSANIPLVAFRQLDRVARSRGLGRTPGETVEETFGRLQRIHAELRADLDVLARAFNARRYGGEAPATEEAGAVVRAFHAIGTMVTSNRR